jgi:hypothetical protein
MARKLANPYSRSRLRILAAHTLSSALRIACATAAGRSRRSSTMTPARVRRIARVRAAWGLTDQAPLQRLPLRRAQGSNVDGPGIECFVTHACLLGR